MAHTLVTFLGRSQLQDGRYREATYRFPDGTKRTSAFFGLTLAGYLRADHVLILGTCGSMWGVLVSSLAGQSSKETRDSEEDRIIHLLDAENDGQVSDELLQSMTGIMKRATGRTVTPRLIPFGKDANEQYAILQVISDAVREGDVSFDLTHGFRHLGMVGFLSAFMLERVGHLNVRDLWYGALDMTDRQSGITPVLQLEGLNRVRRWVDAMNRFDASGDYGVFAPLLIEDGVCKDKAKCLEKAAFHERTLNLSGAAQQIRNFLPVLETSLPGASGIFQARLNARLEWARYPERAEHQRKLAFEYLDRHDFIRAAMFGWEAFVTRECTGQRYDADNHGARRRAVEEFDEAIEDRRRPDARSRAFFTLRTIRNALAHGNPPSNRQYQAILGDADLLEKELRKAFNGLLG